MVFTMFGVVLGLVAIALNAAIIIALAVKNVPTPFSLQTLHLMASLAAADLLLLMFGKLTINIIFPPKRTVCSFGST